MTNPQRERPFLALCGPGPSPIYWSFPGRGIASSVAKRLDKSFPGNIVLDGAGHRVILPPRLPIVMRGGGCAIDALRCVTVAQHLFGIENIVVVHHSNCGATSFTAKGIVDAWKREHHVDISALYHPGSICIEDYEASLKHDTALIRSHPGTPRHVKIVGYFFNIDSGELVEVVSDPAEAPPSARERHTSPYEARPRMVAS